MSLFGWVVDWGWFFAINLIAITLIAFAIQTSISQDREGATVVASLALIAVLVGSITYMFGANGWGWFFSICGLVVVFFAASYLGTYQPTEFTEIDGMSGIGFERYTASLFRSIGYTDVRTTPGSGDYGADVLATKGNVRYAIQCKRYSTSNKVSLKAVQEAVGAREYYRCGGAIVITTSYFTKPATQFANRVGCKLIDRSELRNLFLERQRTEMDQRDRMEESKRREIRHFLTGFLVVSIFSLFAMAIRGLSLIP